MATREVLCSYLSECSRKLSNSCKTCKNNRLRNKEIDFFEEANDNPIPDTCPRLSFDGPAEQTSGYKCPVCNGYTNPYALDEQDRCKHCGYKLNVG